MSGKNAELRVDGIPIMLVELDLTRSVPRDEFDEALALLKEFGTDKEGSCPDCGMYLHDIDDGEDPHATPCRLAAFLKKWEGK